MTNQTISRKTRNQKSFIIEELHLYNILLDTREIFLHGHIEDCTEGDPGVEYRMANNFIKNIKLLELNSDKPIVIHQHNIGGEWAEGMMMYDVIYNSSCHIICVMHGIAASMGSIIPQAADTRVIMPYCQFMIHDGYTDIHELHTYKQSQSWGAMEKKTSDIMMNIYINVCRSGKFFQDKQMDDNKIRDFLVSRLDKKEDWWLDAKETVKYGFADSVWGDSGYENMEAIKSIVNE